MAAQFFQGTIGGAFSQYSMFGNTGGDRRAAAQPRDSFGNPVGGQWEASKGSHNNDALTNNPVPAYASKQRVTDNQSTIDTDVVKK